jgi:hypothetical protein
MLKIDVIQTDQFSLIKSSYSISNLLFDGEADQTTFNKDGWVKIKGRPQKIEQLKSRPNINFRFELKDKSLKSKKTPLVLQCGDVAVYVDYYWEWLDKYENIKELYALVSDQQEPLREEVPFEWNVIFAVPSIEEYEQFGYVVDRGRYASDGTTTITNSDVTRPILDTALFPSPVLPSRHVSLTSEQSYKIIRKHVQENINSAVAFINGDYDFCFKVKKRIKLAKPFHTKREITKAGGKSYRPPKFNEIYHTNRDVQVFEMTHTGKSNGWQDYTPAKGFEGANEGELKQNIDAYLEKLMLVINEPLIECSCCQGAGVVGPTKAE